MQALLTVIVTWLSINFGLPAIYEHPRVAFVSAAAMSDLRTGRVASNEPAGVAAEAELVATLESGQDVHAFYDDRSETIYLPEGWTGTTPAEVSVLVHELVHHLQNAGGIKYNCPAARERPAYHAQTRWLELFARNLSDEFALDPMTILVRTNCLN
jgi:hypothetical protein